MINGVSLKWISFLGPGLCLLTSTSPGALSRGPKSCSHPNIPTEFILHSSARTKTLSEVGAVTAATCSGIKLSPGSQR